MARHRSASVFAGLALAVLANLTIFGTAAVAAPASQAAVPRPVHGPAFDSRLFMPVSELRPGMRGYALTVFKGTRIDRFHIEILGVVEKFNEGKDYILFRALDGPCVTRHLNIAHGMSGSPIYVGGRLVGAISMGIPGTEFPKDPIALATPIEDMLDAWSPDLPSKMPAVGASDAPASRMYDRGVDTAGYAFQPLDLPVSASGMTSRGIERLRTALAPFNLAVTAGGGTGITQNPLAQGATLEPGSAVGVSLVQGDVDLTATGTVTYRAGNRVLLFGHPFTDFGPVDAALTTAYVVDIFPSYQDSIKIGSPIKTVGRIFQDRPFSVGGLIGSMPHMIPITIDIADASLKRRQVFHVRVIDHPLLTGTLVTQVAQQAIEEVHGEPGDTMATVTMDADVDEIGHVHRTNTFYDPVDIGSTATQDVDQLMDLLSSNPFYPLSLKSLTLSVHIESRHDTAELDHIFMRQSQYQPGDTISIGAVLKPYKHDPVTEFIDVKIPENVPNGPLNLTVRGGGAGGGGISIGGMVVFRPTEPLPQTATVGDLVNEYADRPRNDQIVARLTLSTSALIVHGVKLGSLPPAMASIMSATHSSGVAAVRDYVEATRTSPYIVSGLQTVTITVQRKPVIGQSAGSAGGGNDATVQPDADQGQSSSGDGVSVQPSDSQSSDGAADNPADDPTGAQYAAGLAVRLGPESAPQSGIAPLPAVAEPQSHPPGDTAASAQVPAANVPVSPPKTVVRIASVWRQSGATAFAGGVTTNVAVTSKGDIRLMNPLTQIANTTETYIWSLVCDGDGSIYAGTGDGGAVYRFDSQGAATVFYKTGQLEVTAITRDSAGNIYAGTSPHGIIYRITPQGKASLYYRCPQPYVTGLAYDDKRGRLYAATGGGSGCLYAISTTGLLVEPWFSAPQAHLSAIALDKSGNVYAGSSPDGIIYRITPDGSARVLIQTADRSVTSLAVDSAGRVFACTLPNGYVYAVDTNGNAKRAQVGVGAPPVAMAIDSADNVYACGGDTIYEIGPDLTVQAFAASADEQFTSIAVDTATNAVYTGTSTIGSLYRIGPPASGPLTGSYESAVRDAGVTAKWGSISWQDDVPKGSSLTLQTRTGDVARPDSTWSAWSASYTHESGDPIQSGPSRYLQYRAQFTAAAGSSDMPKLKSVRVFYLPRNRAPIVHLTSPHDGDAVSGSTVIRWSASDPDHDTLSYVVSFSADDGATWTPIAGASTAAPASTTSDTTRPAYAPDIAAALQKAKTALAAHPEVPESVKDQIMATAYREADARQKEEDGVPAGVNADLRDTTVTWDTRKAPDGDYLIRVVASDKPSNPIGFLTATATSGTLLVANTTPAVSLTEPVVAADRTVTLRGFVRTKRAVIQAVQYRIDGGDPLSAIPDGGLFDSNTTGFALTTASLAPGPHTIQVQAIDEAGNSGTASVNVVV